MKRYITVLIAFAITCACRAQMTFNHDDSFMNQFLFTETGAGKLKPDLYYNLFHKKYKKSYTAQDKLKNRYLMSEYISKETSYAEDLDSALTKRAKVEALNLADRQIDLAWAAEKSKIESKLQKLSDTINELGFVGAKQETKDWFQADYDKLNQAVESIKEAYMPNNERKAQYLEIYKDIVLAINKCERAVLYLKCCRLCEGRKNMQKIRHAQLSNIAVQAHGRWKSTLVQVTKGNNGSGGGKGLSGSE